MVDLATLRSLREQMKPVRLKWAHSQSVLLLCGEMTAQELRTAKAVAAAVVRDIEALIARSEQENADA